MISAFSIDILAAAACYNINPAFRLCCIVFDSWCQNFFSRSSNFTRNHGLTHSLAHSHRGCVTQRPAIGFTRYSTTLFSGIFFFLAKKIINFVYRLTAICLCCVIVCDRHSTVFTPWTPPPQKRWQHFYRGNGMWLTHLKDMTLLTYPLTHLLTHSNFITWWNVCFSISQIVCYSGIM